MSANTPDPLDVLAGARIRIFRIHRGMSQSDLAAKIGVAFQQVQKCEEGTNRKGAGRLSRIAAVLGYCSHHGIAVVPFGGGTSVVGGLDPIRGEFGSVISLDLRRLDELHWLDETSHEAELGAGVTGPDAERLLGERGFSLGHFPQSFRFATIGGFAATRSSGQNSG